MQAKNIKGPVAYRGVNGRLRSFAADAKSVQQSLEATIQQLDKNIKIAVIEGDLETENDAERIRKHGVKAIQIATGSACHLDAHMIHEALHNLDLSEFDIVFIENVGNLVCPATFALGEHERVVLVSVPEGPDKPAKYPKAFTSSHTFVITKTDLLPYFDFPVPDANADALKLNPQLRTMDLSSTTGTGMDNWLNYLRGLVKKMKDTKKA